MTTPNEGGRNGLTSYKVREHGTVDLRSCHTLNKAERYNQAQLELRKPELEKQVRFALSLFFTIHRSIKK